MNDGPRKSSDAGFTLIELVISIGILGVIIVPIVGSMLFGLAESNGIRDRISDSSSAQVLSTYFAPDVQSAGSSTTTGVDLTGIGTGHCSALAGGTTLRMRLTIPNAGAAADTTKEATVLYFTKPVSSWLTLYRRTCRSNPALDATSTVVEHLDPATPFSPTCSPDVATCKKVTVTFRAFNPASSSKGYHGETFTFIGTRRIQP
jgi:prepilin-type N-terminal cleavage/methylation domain-containing protein